MSVEFTYDGDCPNIEATRANLVRAVAEVGIAPKWTEWESSSPERPIAREFGSPAILVNGRARYCRTVSEPRGFMPPLRDCKRNAIRHRYI